MEPTNDRPLAARERAEVKGGKAPLRVLLAPFVSAGDVHPVLALARILRQRGHEVAVATNDHFAPLVGRLGLDFVSTGTEEEFLAVTRDPHLTRPLNAIRVGIKRSVIPLMQRLYRIIESWYQPGRCVVAAAGLHLGARIAQEKFGVPTATIHLQPASFRSAYQGSKLPYVILPDWYPRGFKRFVHRLLDRGADGNLGAVNEFRAKLGLAPAERFLSHWWNSPELVIGLFPDWYAAPQPDWPPQTLLTGFPLFDGSDGEPMGAELTAFLQAGDSPIVFSQGSLVRHARRYFDVAIDACRRLSRRAVLLTPFAEQVPGNLPAGVLHCEYAPLSRLLPSAAALVHHGGIGTTALALAAGIPQLLVPRMHDHPDNALRVKRLRVGTSLAPWRFNARRLAAGLDALLASSETAARLRQLAARMDPQRDLGRAADALERLAP